MTILKEIISTLAIAMTLLASQTSFALSTDRNQEADITADDVEIDFNTGKRTFIGNVRILQGSLKIKADKLVANYQNGKLLDATAYGNPAKFRQRADGKPSDDEGEGREIYVNGPANSLDLRQQAKLKQGVQVARGNHIYYNRSTGKLKIKGLTPHAKKNSKIHSDPFFNDSGKISQPAPTRKTTNTTTSTTTTTSSNVATPVNLDNIPLLGTTGTQTAPVVATPPEPEYEPPVIDRGETLPEKLVLPKKSAASSSTRSRLIILPK